MFSIQYNPAVFTFVQDKSFCAIGDADGIATIYPSSSTAISVLWETTAQNTNVSGDIFYLVFTVNSNVTAASQGLFSLTFSEMYDGSLGQKNITPTVTGPLNVSFADIITQAILDVFNKLNTITIDSLVDIQAAEAQFASLTNQQKIILQSQYATQYAYAEHSYYFAGSQSWTDYTASVDLTFTNMFLLEANNEFSFYVRHTDIAGYGYHDYVVYLTTDWSNKADIKPKTINIGKRTGANEITKVPEKLVSATLDYLDKPNEKRTLKIAVLDNTISVYWDNVLVLSYVDTSNLVKGQGNIGFMSNNAAVQVDNILVTKITDLMGGDYDNRICGGWDKPIPEYVQQFQSNEWVY